MDAVEIMSLKQLSVEKLEVEISKVQDRLEGMRKILFNKQLEKDYILETVGKMLDDTEIKHVEYNIEKDLSQGIPSIDSCPYTGDVTISINVQGRRKDIEW